VEYASTHPHAVRLRRSLAGGNDVGVRCSECPLTTSTTGSLLFDSSSFRVGRRAARSPERWPAGLLLEWIYVCRYKAIDARIISVDAAYEGAASSHFASVED
jgi:hypothetical protein